MTKTDVHGAFREMWETRPARPRGDRQVAGVASAIARRYDIDPTLVRIAFVVAAFAGIGAALYIAGWIALPEEPADPAAPTARRSPRPILLIGLVIASIGTLASIFGHDNHGGWILPLIIATGLLYLLHRSRGDRGPVAAPTPAQAAGPAVSLSKDAPQRQEGPDPAPPSWDPLGAAPFAWDLPEPSPQPAPAPPRRLPVTPVTLGLALLAGGATAAVLLMTGGIGIGSVPLLIGVPLGVVGLGLVAGAFLHTGRGLIPFAVILGLLAWGSLAAPLDRVNRDGGGDLTVRPASLAQLQPEYRHGAGDLTLDLRGIDLSGDSSPVPVTVDNGLGDVTVLLPPNADVRLDGSAGMGDVRLDGQRSDAGPGAQLTQTSLGDDGTTSGRMLVLTVHTGAGDIAVKHD